MNGVAYIMMKVGNLNVPWLTIVNQHLQSNLTIIISYIDLNYNKYIKPVSSSYQPPSQQSSSYDLPQSGAGGFPQASGGNLPRLPAVDDDLLQYFSNMSDDELMGEYEMVIMQMMEDPEIAAALQYLAEHPNDIMGAASDPTVASGIQKMGSNPMFATLQYIIQSRQH